LEKEQRGTHVAERIKVRERSKKAPGVQRLFLKKPRRTGNGRKTHLRGLGSRKSKDTPWNKTNGGQGRRKKRVPDLPGKP